jgi:GTP-binding protein
MNKLTKETRLPIVAVVGRPNVGKSTLFNRLIGTRKAIESEIPGTTRDRLYAKANWINSYFFLADTAGLMELKQTKHEELADLVKDNVFEAVEEADLVLMVVDFNDKLTQLDQTIGALLRRSKKEVILVVNKCDNRERFDDLEEFTRLGNWQTIGVSASQKKNLGDLLDAIVIKLKDKFDLKDIGEQQSDEINLAIIGRPNVGKSTLFNSFSKTRKMIVSNVSGTTRDSQSEQFEYSGHKINIIDTAGMVRAGKVGRGIEKFSLIRTLQAVNTADIVLVLMDAGEADTHLDRKISGFAAEAGKGIILAVNKIDQVEDFEKFKAEYLYRVKEDFNFLPYVPLIFTSAVKAENVNVILNQVLAIAKERDKVIDQGELDELIELSQGNFGQLPKIYNIKQVGSRPPHFVVTIKNMRNWHFSFSRFLENRLRDNFKFSGTPIVISVESFK